MISFGQSRMPADHFLVNAAFHPSWVLSASTATVCLMKSVMGKMLHSRKKWNRKWFVGLLHRPKVIISLNRRADQLMVVETLTHSWVRQIRSGAAHSGSPSSRGLGQHQSNEPTPPHLQPRLFLKFPVQPASLLEVSAQLMELTQVHNGTASTLHNCVSAMYIRRWSQQSYTPQDNTASFVCLTEAPTVSFPPSFLS